MPAALTSFAAGACFYSALMLDGWSPGRVALVFGFFAFTGLSVLFMAERGTR